MRAFVPWAVEFRYDDLLDERLDRADAKQIVAEVRAWVDRLLIDTAAEVPEGPQLWALADPTTPNPRIQLGDMHKPLHRATVNARSILLACSLGVSWAIWIVMIDPGVFFGGEAAFWLCVVALAFRCYWLDKVKDDRSKPSRIAWIPLSCVIVALVGYGGALAVVQSHYHSEREAIYERAEVRWWRALAAATPRINRISHLMNQSSSRDQSEANLDLAALRKSMPPRGKPPSPSELPVWFSRLNGFFTLATQLLAALVIVLAFSRWRAGVSEAVYRTAMPVAVVAVAASLVGTLPSLSRTLAAVLLTPVIAGLAGAIGGLLVATMEARPDAAAPVRVLGSEDP